MAAAPPARPPAPQVSTSTSCLIWLVVLFVPLVWFAIPILYWRAPAGSHDKIAYRGPAYLSIGLLLIFAVFLGGSCICWTSLNGVVAILRGLH